MKILVLSFIAVAGLYGFITVHDDLPELTSTGQPGDLANEHLSDGSAEDSETGEQTNTSATACNNLTIDDSAKPELAQSNSSEEDMGASLPLQQINYGSNPIAVMEQIIARGGQLLELGPIDSNGRRTLREWRNSGWVNTSQVKAGVKRTVTAETSNLTERRTVLVIPNKVWERLNALSEGGFGNLQIENGSLVAVKANESTKI